MGWGYGRPLSTVAVLVVALLGSVLAWGLLPEQWRPGGAPWVLLATAVAYAVLRVAAYTGWSKRFKHEVLDRFGGDVDDAQTWLLAGLSGAAALAVVALAQRALD